ncbi:MAG: hypothetical protein HC817_15990 [Saprospiraceae bacterium]|nr:hypothetical protein [Saprospiraceae bacterium]
MNISKRNIFFTLGLSFFTLQLNASNVRSMFADSTIPNVFVLGQYDGLVFESMKQDYDAALVTACKNDVETAYYCWIHMLKHIETHAVKSNFDINGVKMWLYVFWEKDGSIGYMSYFLKPNSKNVKADEMTNFLNDFRKNYTFPVKFDRKFSNYSTANFPVMIEKPVQNANPNGGSATTNTGKN